MTRFLRDWETREALLATRTNGTRFVGSVAEDRVATYREQQRSRDWSMERRGDDQRRGARHGASNGVQAIALATKHPAESMSSSSLLASPVKRALATQRTAIGNSVRRDDNDDAAYRGARNDPWASEAFVTVSNGDNRCSDEDDTESGEEDGGRERTKRARTKKRGDDSRETNDGAFSTNRRSSVSSAAIVPRKRRGSEARQRLPSCARSLAGTTLISARRGQRRRQRLGGDDWETKRRNWSRELRDGRGALGVTAATSSSVRRRSWRDRFKFALAFTALLGASSGAVYSYLASCANVEECGRAIAEFADHAWREISSASV